MNEKSVCERESDFALVISGINELTTEVENALFEAGCDDATLTFRYGRLYMEFTRVAPSLKDAILSAIRDVRKAGIGAEVLQVDQCNLVTRAEIARRIGRSRQLVSQYIMGKRGPGKFPPPVCQLNEDTPLWAWCEVSYWLYENDMIKPEVWSDAEVVATINNALETIHQQERNPELVAEVTKAVSMM